MIKQSKKLKKDKKAKKETKNMKRFFAYIVDWYLASVLAGIPVLLIYSMESGQATNVSSLSEMSIKWGSIAGLLAIIAASAYYVVIPTYCYKGQTLGKKLLGIKVVKLDSSEITIKSMFKREILGIMLVEGGLVCSSDYIRQMLELSGNQKIASVLWFVATFATVASVVLINTTEEKRMIHDYIGGTKVIEV